MRLFMMAARPMVSICVDWQPAPDQRPVFCFALMARRWLRVGRPRGDVCSHERAFYGSLENFGAQRIEALAFATQQVLLLACAIRLSSYYYWASTYRYALSIVHLTRSCNSRARSGTQDSHAAVDLTCSSYSCARARAASVI